MTYVVIGGAVLAIILMAIVAHLKNLVLLGMAGVAALAAVIACAIGDVVYAAVFAVCAAALFWPVVPAHDGFSGEPTRRPWQRLPNWAALRQDKREAATIMAGAVVLVAFMVVLLFVQ